MGVIVTGSKRCVKAMLPEFSPLGETLNFDHCCQLYAFLLQYDLLHLVRIHYPRPWDEPLQARDLINFLGPIISPTTRTIVMKTIDIFNMGARDGEILDLLCKEFGTGSLLLLCDHLDLALYVFSLFAARISSPTGIIAYQDFLHSSDTKSTRLLRTSESSVLRRWPKRRGQTKSRTICEIE